MTTQVEEKVDGVLYLLDPDTLPDRTGGTLPRATYPPMCLCNNGLLAYVLDGRAAMLESMNALALELGTISVIAADAADAATLAAWRAEVLNGSVDEFPDAGIHFDTYRA